MGYHSPLQCAAAQGQTALVTSLLKKGARVNDVPTDAEGGTALQFAAIRGDFKMLKVLLDAGADINAPPSKWDGRTAIEGAAEWGRLDMVSLLMEAGADIQGRENANYRQTVYRAWVHGHHVLAGMVQQWKSERYGAEDCEPIESIIRSMEI
jgi:ankyrin repeat protein